MPLTPVTKSDSKSNLETLIPENAEHCLGPTQSCFFLFDKHIYLQLPIYICHGPAVNSPERTVKERKTMHKQGDTNGMMFEVQ